jgi:hypothetical protein
MKAGGVLHRAMPTIAGVLIALAICVPVSMLVFSELDVESKDQITTSLVATIAALAISGAGVLAWCVHRGIAWSDPSRLSPLWSWLGGRRALLVGYVLIVGAWAALCVVLGMSTWLELLAEGLGPSRTRSTAALTSWQDWILAAVFVATQAAFLWSGGKLRIGASSPKPYRFAVSAAIFSLAMSILVAGLVLAMLEGVDRMDVRSRPEDPAEIGQFLLALLLGNWTIWLPIAWFALRDVDRPTGLSRLSGMLLAGSWIEVAVALPIELVARGRHENCPCASGSWIALAVGGPLLLWSLGPAAYLLYRRERTLNARTPGHAKRLLARRSTKIRVTPDVEAT